MDHILPFEILCKILSLAVATPSLLVNFSDEHYKFTHEELLTSKDIDALPMFEHSRIGLAYELSFFNWPVDFYHNMPVYRAHQHHARTGILVCKTFKTILTPVLYQCAVLATSSQARALVATLEDTQLAALVKTLIICPRPLFSPKRALVDRVVGACPNLCAFHNFSIYHSPTGESHANTRLAALPVVINMARLTHDPFSLAQIAHQPTLCHTLVFLELTTPACHWAMDLPVLQVTLPSLVSLKMENKAWVLAVMEGCSMPVLQRLCLTRPLRHADVGRQSGAFLKRHGKMLTQLEYPSLLWGAEGEDVMLGMVCPMLKELIIDPMCCIATGPMWDIPPIQGAPGHPGVSEIGFRNIVSTVSTGMGDSISGCFNLLINTEAFPMLNSVHDMAWHGNTRRVEDDWGVITDLCVSRGVLLMDWAGSIVV